jgi:glycosyltransferase involved in cell wall biosynthesis
MLAAIEAYAHQLIHVRDNIDMFLAPSAFLRSKLIESGFPAERVVHIPLFLPDEMFTHDVGRDDGYLLFMARLDSIKGIYALLDAGRRVPRVKIVLVGQIEDNLAKNLLPSLPPNAKYLGLQQGQALRHLLLQARAVILPSIWYENQPFAIIEAFAAGKPVIASDLGGMTELVKHRETGLLVPPGDVKALAEAMLWMDGNPTAAKTMGEHARNYSMMEHSSERHYEKLMQAYQSRFREYGGVTLSQSSFGR